MKLMEQIFKRGVVAVCCVAMLGCTHLQVVADGQGAVRTIAASEQIRGGEELTVATRDGKSQSMRFTKFEADELHGVVGSNDVRIKLDQIERIERREMDGTKSAGVAAVVVGAILLFAVALSNSIAKDVGKIYDFKKN